MEFVLGLRCVMCQKIYSGRRYDTCPRCGIEGILDVQYDYRLIGRRLTRCVLAGRRDESQWRYRELLPIRADAVLPLLSVGWTPFIPAPSLARHVGIRQLFLKDDGRNATGSLKTGRALWVWSRPASAGRKSSPVPAPAMRLRPGGDGSIHGTAQRYLRAGPCARAESDATAGFRCHGLRVRGSYEQAFQLSQRACEKWGWYNRNCAINPYLLEGKKTVGLEIAEQLAWQLPDWVAVSVGDGCTMAGFWKAFAN